MALAPPRFMKFKSLRIKTGWQHHWRSFRQRLGIRKRQWSKRLLGDSGTVGASSASSYGSIYGRTGSIVGRY